MKRMKKAVMVALATVALLAGTMPMAQGVQRWYGWTNKACEGENYVNSVSFEPIHAAIVAGTVLSYSADDGVCVAAAALP